MTKYFEGKVFVKQKDNELKKKVNKMIARGITPNLASVMIGDNDSSSKYLLMKKAAAERIGCSLGVANLNKSETVNVILEKINNFNLDNNVHGVMIQLPLPSNYSDLDREKLINTINPPKDIDGMRNDSPFLAPVVMAVMQTLKQLKSHGLPPHKDDPCAVVGADGFVGKKLVHRLKDLGYNVYGLDVDTKYLEKRTLNADIIISATGVPGLIKPSMVKDGVVLIDVGAPIGDIDRSAYEKASFVSPVPGGIGPLTIHYLLSNLVDSTRLA